MAKRKPRKPVPRDTGSAQKSRKIRTVTPDTEDEFGFEETLPVEEEPESPRRQARSRPADDKTDKPDASAPGSIMPQPTVSLDKRKLTKKQEAKLAEWHGDTYRRKVSSHFAAQAEVARKKYGVGSVFVGHKDENVVVGIPCPALVMEYLFSMDVFPLGLILHLNGPPKSMKSAMLFEFYRWFWLAGGGGYLNEAETKWNPDWMRSIVRYGEDDVVVVVNRCDSVEDWEQKLTYAIQQEKKALTGTKEDPGPGRTVPILYGVDSIMGKVSWETQEKVIEHGFAGRSFPVEALSITNYLKTVPQMIDGWPFALVLNNHLKMSKDDTGRDVRRTGGGAQVNFQESLELEMRPFKDKIKCLQWEGAVIKIKTVRNSFGPGRRDILTRILWHYENDPETGALIQRTAWDWNWALINLLLSADGSEKERLSEVIHVTQTATGPATNAAYSKTLGMKADNAIPWSDLGAKIMAIPELVEKIRRALCIVRRPLLKGDYLRQLGDLQEKMT
jgi:hypothetical protein